MKLGNKGTPEDKARIRMKAFMEAWKEGGTDEIQDAYNGFTGKGPAHDEAHGDYSTFAVTINGKTYLMGAPDKSNPIFWIR